MSTLADSQQAPGMGWLFLALAVLFACKLLHPHWRRGMRWGRTQTSIPMSLPGGIVCLLVFLILASAGFGLLPFLAVFFSVPLLAVAGAFDSWLDSRKRRAAAANAPSCPPAQDTGDR